MKQIQKLAALLLTAALLLGLLSGCAKPAETTPEPAPEAEQTAPETQTAPEEQTVLFTDSAGRQVELPAAIARVSPSGTYAQLMTYTLRPGVLISLSSEFSEAQKAYIEADYQNLPVFGQFYGKNSTMNFEEIIAAAPDVILDMGDYKEGIEADLDNIQEKTGIPVVFIEANLDTMAQAYETLGTLLDAPERAGQLADYTRDVLALAEKNRKTIADSGSAPVSVLYAMGEDGLEVCGQNSIHGEIIEVVGAVNAAQFEAVSGAGNDAVSMEQILQWQPETILLAPGSCFETIGDDPLWQDVSAVQLGRVYEIPMGPYNWMDRPPSIQRLLGILWLGNLLYPAVYDYDMTEKAQEYLQLFFRYDLSEEQAKALMAHSTYLQK